MVKIASYILSVIVAAVLVGLLSTLTNPKTGTGGMIKVICGIFMLTAVIQPLVGFRFEYLTDYAEQSFLEGEDAAEAGKKYSRDAMAAIITEKTRAYILDKAGLYRAEVQVEVELTGDDIPIPERITVKGNYSPKAKTELEAVIASELGVPKECQIWIGTP